MNVLVAVARTPFARCAAADRGAVLVDRLNATAGHKAELMTIPSCPVDDERMLDEALLCGLLQTINADRLIALNFPAYLMPYPSAAVWIATDADLPRPAGAGGRAEAIAAMLARADRRAFGRAARLFAGSAALAERIAGWSGVRADPLPVPEEGDTSGWNVTIARLLA